MPNLDDKPLEIITDAQARREARWKQAEGGIRGCLWMGAAFAAFCAYALYYLKTHLA